MKAKEFDKLIKNISLCDKCLNLKKKNGKNCSLINFYGEDMAKKIPSIWTDWYNRLDSKIMIVGQDWGPYVDMEKFHLEYKKDESVDNWKKLIEEEKSLTKKMLEKYLNGSSGNNINLDDIFITNAIMCARSGNNYRGDNIKLKESTINCMHFLKRQIEIVKPRIILTLGYFPLLSLSRILDFTIEDNLSKTIAKIDVIKKDRYIIIPLYHPTAQISKENQLKQYSKIWKFL